MGEGSIQRVSGGIMSLNILQRRTTYRKQRKGLRKSICANNLAYVKKREVRITRSELMRCRTRMCHVSLNFKFEHG